ncbi:hypothetical protein OIU76_015832 [Salix suchowensis]|nr:hypothetical protein OIU76_015832 [Salix suchowensis]
MLSGLIRKFMASDVVVYVVKWFNEQNVTALVAVAVIGLLMICCCCIYLKRFGGQTEKAPGKDGEVIIMEKISSDPASLGQRQQTDPFYLLLFIYPTLNLYFS